MQPLNVGIGKYFPRAPFASAKTTMKRTRVRIGQNRGKHPEKACKSKKAPRNVYLRLISRAIHVWHVCVSV